MNDAPNSDLDPEELLSHQRKSWRSGSPISVREYCQMHPGLENNQDALLDLIYNEVLLRREADHDDSDLVVPNYELEFPEIAAQLKLLSIVDEGIQDLPQSEANVNSGAEPDGLQRDDSTVSMSGKISGITVPKTASLNSSPSSTPLLRVQSSKGDALDVAQLLRSRLLIIGVVVTINYAMAFFQMRALFFAGALTVIAQVVISLICLCVCGLLWVRRQASLAWLRGVERILFGLPAVQLGMFLVERLWLNGDLVRSFQPDEVFRGHLFNTTVLCFFPLVVSYGVMIPNTGWRCFCVTLSISILPFAILLGGLPFHWDDISPHLAIFAHGLLWVFAWMSVAVVIASFGSYRIYSLVQQVAEAKQLGHYRLQKKIGEGGMGEVYLAEHLLLKQPCAIKVIRPDRVDDEQTLKRFEKEVQATARLKHPNCVEIYDYGLSENGTLYYVMEYLPGMTFDQIVKQQGALPVGRVIHFLQQVCGPLREAHSKGLIHRDIKPANIIVSHRGGIADVCKVLDFGLVKDLQATESVGTRTQLGAIAGTPAYMSPEQIAGNQDLDGRSDIYSLGAVAYFLLTSRAPFTGNAIQIMLDHVNSQAADIREHNSLVPEAVSQWISRCLQKDPAERFKSVAAALESLSSLSRDHSWSEQDAEACWQTPETAET